MDRFFFFPFTGIRKTDTKTIRNFVGLDNKWLFITFNS